MLQDQQEYIHDLINSHKEEVGELVSPRSQTFRNKGIEKQFLYNMKVSTKLKKVKSLLKKQKLNRALESVRDLLKLVEDHNDDLLIAENSRHGWLTVHQLRGGSSLSSDLQKKVEKIDSRLDKSRQQQRGDVQRYRPGKGRQDSFRMEGKDVQTFRRKQGPEEALLSFSKTNRQGSCTHCSESGHFYRECPDFWKSVNESRKKNFTSN